MSCKEWGRKRNSSYQNFVGYAVYSVMDWWKGNLSCHQNHSWLWHRRLCYLNFKTINKLAHKKLADDLLNQVYYKDHICEAYQAGKETRSSFPSIASQNTSRYLELLHLDLFNPVTPSSINGNKYTLVIIDDYSRYTCIRKMRPWRSCMLCSANCLIKNRSAWWL